MQKRLLRPLLGLQQDAQHLIRELPAVHRLLVLLPALQEQYLDSTGISDVPMALKALADTISYVGRRDVEGVEGDDFRGLGGGHY